MSFISIPFRYSECLESDFLVLNPQSAPFVERLIKKGFEVLYLTDPVDEAVATNMAKFGDYDLVDVSKEGLKLDESEEETKKNEAVAKEFQAVADFLKTALGEKVEKVTGELIVSFTLSLCESNMTRQL